MNNLYVCLCAALTSGLSVFLERSLQDISAWLLVMFSVILADLMAGFYKVLKRDDMKLRVSKGLRDTMGKMAVYFSFVVAAVLVEKVSDIEELAKMACLCVIGGEGVSIVSNLLKAHGYELDVKELIKSVARKAKVSEGIIKKEEEK